MFSMALDRKTLWMALFAGVMLVFLVLLVQRYQPASAQDAAIEYAENGTGVVATFSATDPDMDDITWTVTGTDDFNIDGETGELEFNTPPNYEMPAGGNGNDSNTYEITVTADDGNGGTETKTVMVKVTDVEERATIELSTRQPVVGQGLTATLINDDEVASGVRWTWEKKDGATWVDATGTTGTPTTDPSYSNTYTPVQSDINAELRVGVEYIDNDDDNQAIAAVAFEQSVAASVGGTNELPEFADDPAATRTIAEDASAGTAVGDPVTATDDHRTALTYMMVQATPPATDEAPASFEIDPKTGQISVSASAELNYDPEGVAAAVREYTLTVSVADPDGHGRSPAMITVTVNVTDVAEAPKVTGPATEMVDEDFDSDLNTADVRELVVATYTGTDEAGVAIGLTLEGADAAAFGLTRDSDGTYDLSFNTEPDFEKPADTGSNNEYQVTVAATDRGLKATKSVVVRVANVNEDGTIKLTPAAPTVGKSVMAELSDKDVVQERTVTWLWSSKVELGNCDEDTTFGRGDRIAGATSDTYTPTAAECLRVTARYTDGEGGNKSAMMTVMVGVRESNVPVFTDADPIIRSINEDQDAGEDVGSVDTPGAASPVAATDADNNPDTAGLTYTIENVTPSSGTASFSIENDGQLQIEEKLDHEEQASYILEVKATDSTGNSATVTVTVMVNNVNDDPGAIMDSRRNNDYAENGTAVVATFSSEDPDGDSLTWTVTGTDADDFNIDGETGELEFNTPPNYEMPAGGNGNDSNTYEITVTAADGNTGTAMKDVMVKVTDVEERATIELSTRQPVVGQLLTATLKNDDEVESNVRWTWTGIEGTATPFTTPSHRSTYMPLAGDANDRLRVGVKYIDTDNREQTVAAVAFEQPVGPSLAAGAPNVAPTFEDGATQTRMIAENAAVGTAVGDPVTATDDHRTALTYQLTGTGSTTKFEIDPKTGQISVREGAKLNYDVATDRMYTLTVTVPDPDGAADGTATVTVTVTDVAEAPKVTGPATKSVMENSMEPVATYMGRDEAGAAIGLTLEGADAAAFGLTRNADDDYDLAFNTAPDFEKPADTGSNNEYQVTVVATDRGLKATKSVVVRVTNMEEAGEIELTPELAEERTVGKSVMAELSDKDVVQARTVTWLWSSKTDTGTCDDTAGTTFARGDRITGATSDTYTPTAAECLRVTARYTDGEGGNKSAMMTFVVEARESNVPMFTDDDPIIRSVNENVIIGTEVGTADAPGTPTPVEATDADSGDTLTYTIVSVDPSSGAALFGISNMGQLTTKAMLDHEEQASYVLEVKVTDGTGNSAMVTVTVNVNDVNEAPEEIVFSTSGLTVRGSASVRYAEDRTDAVATYTASGPEAASARWSLEGVDAGDFSIGSSSGVLTFTFRSSPDFENPADADMDNVYMVTVKARDSEGTMATRDVTVRVTDVVEDEPVIGGDSLLDTYDPDGDGIIEKADMRLAVGKFFADPPTLSRADMRRLVAIYFMQ